MKFKKILIPCAVAAFMLIGCNKPQPGGEDLKGTYDVKLWVSEVEGVSDLTVQQIRAFEAANEGIVIKETVEPVSEANAATQVLTDIDAAADIYCFAQDQTARLIEGKALAKLGQAAATEVKENNDAGSVGAVTSGSDLYAYPLTSDNGYFMYYDKSVITNEDHLKNIEDLLADCEAAGKKFAFEAETSAWYLASWFFGTGCTSTWTTDPETGEINGFNDTFNSDAGVVAAHGIRKLVKSSAYLSSSEASAFTAATPAACLVSGTWVYNTVSEMLGDNMGVVELPSFTVGGKTYHLGSFSGNKLMGVKPQSDAKRSAVLSKLALYLTGEKCQLERFDAVAWGPSNLNAQKSEAVQANPALAALAAQNNYAKPQGQIHGSWWDIAKVIAVDVKNAAEDTDEAMKAVLEKYQAALEDIFAYHPWGIVGSFTSWGGEADIEMTQNEDGTWEKTLEIPENGEFKIRKGSDWDTFKSFTTLNAPEGKFAEWSVDANIKCLVEGTYKVKINLETWVIDITEA